MLHRSGLVISNSPGQGKSLRERGRKKKNKEVMGKFTNVFAIRYRGFDPEKILNGLLPWFGWLFTCPAVIGFVLIFMAAPFFWHRSTRRSIRDYHPFSNFWFDISAIWLVKVLHEFGHGLSCKKFGGVS